MWQWISGVWDMQKLNTLLNTTLAFVSLAYPLLWFWQGQHSLILSYVPFILAFCWGVKALLQAGGLLRLFAMLMAVILVLVGASQRLEMMYWYPVIINGMMLAIFGGSLWQKQTFVERLARLQEPNLSEQGVRYTRKITQLWCGVFIFNLLISTLLIIIGQIEYWAIYTGMIAYVIMGVVMGGEWLYRKTVIQQ